MFQDLGKGKRKEYLLQYTSNVEEWVEIKPIDTESEHNCNRLSIVIILAQLLNSEELLCHTARGGAGGEDTR